MTDGAVRDTRAITDLIETEMKKSANIRVNCIGMGSGASQELVQGAAKAGLGAHALIEDITLVEEKVIVCMQKIYLPMRRITGVTARTESGTEIPLKTDMLWLENDK